MQLASGTHIPDGLLAAMTLLNEKPRHGFESGNPAPHPGIDECNSTLAKGLRASLALDAARQSERARYYGSTTGRFLSPDPSGLYYANPTNPQSLNLYTYGLNNPLVNTDPFGLDCVYFNDAGNGVESIDHHSSSGECGKTGGDWVNGTTSASQIQYDPNSDTFNIQSSSMFHSYNSTAYAPGPGGGGTDSNGNPISCSGNCDTANGYQSSFHLPTFGYLGLAFNLAAQGGSVTGSFGLVFDSHGHIGAYGTYGGGTGEGAGVSAGVQSGAGIGNSICSMGGPFQNVSGTGGEELAGTVDYFQGEGDAPGGVVRGVGVTGGIGGGGGFSATETNTNIHPFGGHSCAGGTFH